MRLLMITLVPMIWLTVGAVLIGILSPVPIFGGVFGNAFRRCGRALTWMVSPLRRLIALKNAGHEARIADLEERNVALEARVAELTSCILRSLAIALETQQQLEARQPESALPDHGSPTNMSSAMAA